MTLAAPDQADSIGGGENAIRDAPPGTGVCNGASSMWGRNRPVSMALLFGSGGPPFGDPAKRPIASGGTESTVPFARLIAPRAAKFRCRALGVILSVEPHQPPVRCSPLCRAPLCRLPLCHSPARQLPAGSHRCPR